MQWNVEAPPLPRSWLDAIAPLVRILFGLAFIAWSWASTILVLNDLLSKLIPGVTDRIIVGFLFATSVSVVEFVTSERYVRIYWSVLLVLDASFTGYQTGMWLAIILSDKLSLSFEHFLLVVTFGYALGIVVGRWGETLLFGRRRSTGSAKA